MKDKKDKYSVTQNNVPVSDTDLHSFTPGTELRTVFDNLRRSRTIVRIPGPSVKIFLSLGKVRKRFCFNLTDGPFSEDSRLLLKTVAVTSMSVDISF